MNTNRRPRKRPRITSFSFTALHHVVAVEAAYQLTRRWWREVRIDELTRSDFAALYGHTWRTRAQDIFIRRPDWRVLP